jgi:processive 1,2-diacylglycerol beta-glucosyltransferase
LIHGFGGELTELLYRRNHRAWLLSHPVSSHADILILTAGFGEGHNSAALNLCEALEAGASPLRLDPCALGAPVVNDWLRWLYREVTTHVPWVWRKTYESTDRQDFTKENILFMKKPEMKLRELVLEHQPKAIVSTYPLYPYFLERIFASGVPKVPVFTVVTDSIEINAAWRKAPTDFWLVSDIRTREALVRQGLPDDRVIDTGFPVPPHFSDLQPVSEHDALDPFRILYFPTPKKPHVRRVSRELLDATDADVHLTIVLGRNVRKLYQRAREIKEGYPGRVSIKGWTRQVPELINSHHLVVGKAGGATVHEALAAACPMLIHHLVPGQEEGNLALLRALNGGYLADTPGDLARRLREFLADDAKAWREMKRSLALHARPNASQVVADFILGHWDVLANEGR